MDEDTFTCPECEGEGVFRLNVTRNRDGVWEYDEEECGVCRGTGGIPVEECTEDREYRYAREVGAA